MGCTRFKKISKASFYDKIDFFHKQCLAFAASKEKRFLEGRPLVGPDPWTGDMKPIDRAYVSVDRQFYTVNWKYPGEKRKKGDPRRHISRLNRRVYMLAGIASCEEKRKYIFGITVNYDTSVSPEEFAAHMDSSGEDEWLQCFRRYARYWTNEEHQAAAEYNEKVSRLRELRQKKLKGEDLSVEEQSQLKYLATEKKPDVEAADEGHEKDTQLPWRGMQVHEDYTVYGHFLFLREILGWTEKVRLFFEQESGMRAACLTAFADMIKQQRCDAFYILHKKNLEFGDYSAIQKDAFWRIKQTAEHLGCSEHEAKLHLLIEAIRNAKPRAKGAFGTKDKFAVMPFGYHGEPDREVAYLTDRVKFSPEGVRDENHLAWLYNEATMHNLNSFFNQVRASISPLSRPEGNAQTQILNPATSNRRRGKPYKYRKHYTYKPEMVQKYLDIFRVFHNFVLRRNPIFS